jgi:hypothetical protein
MVLATYLLSDVPFALLIPVDLLDVARKPNIFLDAPHHDLALRFEAAGKLIDDFRTANDLGFWQPARVPAHGDVRPSPSYPRPFHELSPPRSRLSQRPVFR